MVKRLIWGSSNTVKGVVTRAERGGGDAKITSTEERTVIEGKAGRAIA